jgi:iron(III) transport system permease protein
VRGVVALGRWRWPLAFSAWGFVLATALVPLAALALVSVLDSWGRGWGPANWTLARHLAVLHDAELRRALANSLGLALAAAALCGLIALTIVYAGVRLQQRWARVADRISFVAFALPGLVVGLAMILAFAGGRLNLYGSFAMLLLAYVLRFLGIPVRSLSARLAQMAPELEAAGAVAGLSRMRIVVRIVVPLLAPAMFAGFVLVFINSVKEISATSLLATQGHETLAYEAYLRFQEGNYTQGSVLSLWMIALVLAMLGLGRWLGGRRTPTEGSR